MTITINGTTGISGVDGSAGTPALQGSDTNTGVYFGTDLVYISTGGTAAVTVDSGQRTTFPTTIAVGAATPSTSGSGVSFPATQSASTDANTLDDYEEGTWTPTLYGDSSAGTTTYDGQIGRYTKIGRQVTVTAIVGATATTGTGELRFGGLPFTCNSTIGSYTSPWVGSVNWGGGTYLSVVVITNSTTCEVVYLADDAAQVNQQITNETQSWRFTVTYFV